jgi:hypothetical protein
MEWSDVLIAPLLAPAPFGVIRTLTALDIKRR